MGARARFRAAPGVRVAFFGALSSMALLGLATCSTERPREVFGAVSLPPATGAGPGNGGGSGAPANGGASGRGSSAGGSSVAGSGGSGDGSGGRTGGTGGKSNTGSGGSDAGRGGSGGSAGTSVPSEGGEGGESPVPTPPEDNCGPPPITSGPFTKARLREAASDCATHQYCRFEATADWLEKRAAAYATDPSAENLDVARDAWRRAMAAWSRVELFQFGPVASRAMSAGKDSHQGLGIRERIYSWPLTARCRVEDQIASQAYLTQGFANVLVSSKGLFGLEYLLFYGGSDTACLPATATGKAWPTLGTDEITARKRAYAAAVAGNVTAEIRGLIELWRPEGGNFRETFVSVSGYPNEQEAMNVLAWALVYVEREVKDWKLGIPAGYTLMHPVSGQEAPFSGVSSENLRGNLQGFRSLFEGCGEDGEGIGFDDWLVEAGHADLANRLLAALSNAESAADTAPPLEQATPAELEALYRALKALTDPLKAEMFGAGSPLNLKLPDGVASDTD
jgi:predicted lipoprotein